MKKVFSFISLGVVLGGVMLGWGRLSGHDSFRQKFPHLKLEDAGKPWNGGKPTAPIDLVSSLEGEIAPGEWVDVELQLISRVAGCVSLSSRVRGLDGIEVSDESVWDHPDCGSSQAPVRQIRVRAADGVSGMIAVDLHLELESGKVYEVSRAVAFRAQGAAVLPGVTEPGSE